MVFDFNEWYKRNSFINFLRTDLFWDKFNQNYVQIKPERKTAFFVENWIFQLWTVQLWGEEISVLEIKQKSKNDPRVTLTQDAFKIMGDLLIDNAIVALYVDDKSSWRFSLLTTKYEDFKKTTSNPKRFSFILWPNEKVRTVNQQLIKKWQIKDFEDLVSRFDVEVVRKEFFETYLELFVRLYKEILKDKEFSDLLTSKNVDLVSFTKNLLWKIIFLYFIQQKWWLWLWKKSSLKYWEWNKDFMRVMWNNFKKQWESMCTHEKRWYFYNDYLERLFYAWLNVDRRNNDDRFEQLQMKLPYLNWWLFKEEYKDWQINIAKINNDIFSNIEKKWDDADWILDIFDRYNFTIDEDSLYDTDIAVDPEMLGRIFEKMISISSDNIQDVLDIYAKKKTNAKFDFGKDLNKKLGAFYTPREIVHYMTRESLIAYLSNKTNLSENNIRVLFDLKEKFLLKNDIENANYPADVISEIKDNIIDIDTALQNVKILDPAVWSGAFPMWLLHEISSMRYYIYWAFIDKFWDKAKEYMIFNEDKNKDTISLYKIKKDIILNNIHWVDIDPWAIDIAKLRFRLSLVVDEQEPEPLPNFEFKFVCANSLIPLDDYSKEKDLFSSYDEPKLETLKSYKRDYYNADSIEVKKQLKERIKAYTKTDYTLFSDPTKRAKQMEEFWENFDNSKHSHSFFDAWLMLSESRWFDIVIWNPPYKIVEKVDPLKSTYDKLYEVASWWKRNLYHLFFEKWINLLKNKWILSYITPDTYLAWNDTEALREYFYNNVDIKEIVHYKESDKIFENVTQAVAINILIKQHFWKSFFIKESNNTTEIKYEDLTKENKYVYKWKNAVIDKMNLMPKIFSDICEWYKWDVNLWLKKDYFITQKAEKSLPLVRGIQINKYQYLPGNEYCYIAALSKNHTEYQRIVFQEVANAGLIHRVKWTLLQNVICWDSCNIIFSKKDNIDNKYILWILNSKAINYYFKFFNQTNHVPIWEIKKIPFPNTDNEIQNKIIWIVNTILEKKKDKPETDTSDLENQIDQMVYQLYWLTDEEIQIVEDSLK